MTGSPLFLIEKTEQFQRSFKKLAKSQGKTFLDVIAPIIDDLAENPYPQKSRSEPLPGKLKLPEGWTFHKLEIWSGKGASGQVRLMYLVNERALVLRPLWIYTHGQFAKRPGDKDLTTVIQEALGEPPASPDP